MAKTRLLCVLILLIPAVSFCMGVPDKPFYKDKGHGWYNYEDPEPEPQKKKDDEFKKPVIQWDTVKTLPPERLNELIKDVLHYANVYPTQENVKDFLKLQDVAIERSREYMKTFMQVVQANPELSKENEIPTSKFGQDEKYRIKKAQMERVLVENREEFALLFFYSPDCGYCEKQMPVLEYFAEESGWLIKPINIKQDQTAAQNFKVSVTPSIVMARRNSPDWLLISSGIIALSDLQERLVMGIEHIEN